MMISTKGRYALRFLADLAEHSANGYVPMKDVAERQGISQKYLEQIIPSLTKGKIIKGLQGKGGGYRLIKSPEQCKIGDILRLTEGDLAPVSCLEKRAKPCKRKQQCPTLSMWSEFYAIVNKFFDEKTLADIIKK